MRIIVVAVAVIAALFIAGSAYVRLAPTEPTRWHVDPLEADPPGDGGWLVRPEGGDAAAPVFDATPRALLSALDRIARDTPRTEVLAGSVEEGRITYVTRSRLWGFPDYTTVTALPAGDGATVAILARLRFGQGDLGVNRARVEGWLERLQAAEIGPG